MDPAWPARPYVYAIFSYDAPLGLAAPYYGGTSDSDPCPTPEDGCPAQTVLARLQADAAPAMTSRTDLISGVCRQFQFHDGGGLRFGPDGSLYAAFGEGAYPGIDYGHLGGNPCGDPPYEGGTLRSQDRRTSGDPLGLSGTLLRVDPNTGASTMLAYGLRNPFRLAVRTGEVWIGGVGNALFEELNRVGLGEPVRNFGWPCYEGPGRQQMYDDLNLPLCESLYAEGTATGPSDYFCHSGERPNCQLGWGAVSGLTFYEGGTYPPMYAGALFFADYTRETIFVKRAGLGGQLGPMETFATGIGGPVDLRSGPGGDLFSIDIYNGQVVRSYAGLPSAPPPEAPRPTATIDRPTPDTIPYIGRQLDFSGSATNESGRPLPPSALRWTLVVLHCADEDHCHRHFIETKEGVASGSFTVPPHEAPYKLEVVLRATGTAGSDQTSVVLAHQPAKK